MAWADVNSKADAFTYVFNRTALGLGVLVIGWLALEGYWLRVGMGLVLVVVYFALHAYVDAP